VSERARAAVLETLAELAREIESDLRNAPGRARDAL
jgi:hypothetical protein